LNSPTLQPCAAAPPPFELQSPRVDLSNTVLKLEEISIIPFLDSREALFKIRRFGDRACLRTDCSVWIFGT